jgi:hypothetical protein
VVFNDREMRRALVTIATSLGLLMAVPGVALGTLTEVGLTTSQMGQVNPTWPAPACPSAPCLAISRTTGFQVKVATDRSMFVVPRTGSIVAWSITLGKPTKAQIAFFDANEGGVAQAGIAVLRAGPHLTYRLLAQSPLVDLEPYFGETAQFPLAASIPVVKGNVIALTVPTWAPALALGFGHDTSWRASRPKKQCSNTQVPSAHQTPQSVIQYSCLYTTARLTYSATLISTP